MRDTKEALENVSMSLETLQEATTKLHRSLQSEHTSLSNTLNDPACSSGNATHTCNSIRDALDQLAVSANFNGVIHTHTHTHLVGFIVHTNVSHSMRKYWLQ